MKTETQLSRGSQLLSVLSLVDDFEDCAFLAVFMNMHKLLLLATLVCFCKC